MTDTARIDAEDLLPAKIIGNSLALRDIRALIQRIAVYDATVSIYGETGTGKELVARALHYCSPQASGPFVPVNCGAFPEQLIESELFGHKRGAFTDARDDRSGLIEQANGGTLFLDEVDALSPHAQVVLLRFLQDRQYRRVGGARLRTADVRLVVASNIRLEELESEDSPFRADLYYRLNVLPVDLPPLRDRGDDIVILATHFLAKYRAHHNLPGKFLRPSAFHWITQHDWPGNVRELENAINRGILLAPHNAIEAHHLDPRVQTAVDAVPTGVADLPFKTAKARVVDDFEKRYLLALLADCEGNITRAAQRAETERRTLGRLLQKHGIERGAWTAG